MPGSRDSGWRNIIDHLKPKVEAGSETIWAIRTFKAACMQGNVESHMQGQA